MSNKPKPDNRKNNVERIQRNINSTIENIELANELIEKTDNENAKQELKEKNKRREIALDGLRSEIKDEAKYAKRKGFE